MGIEVSWDRDYVPALRFDVSGKWQYADMFTAIEQGRAMLHEASLPIGVVIINHLPDAEPPGFSLTETRRLIGSVRMNTIMINVAGDSLTLHMLQLLRFVYPKLGERIKLVLQPDLKKKGGGEIIRAKKKDGNDECAGRRSLAECV